MPNTDPRRGPVSLTKRHAYLIAEDEDGGPPVVLITEAPYTPGKGITIHGKAELDEFIAVLTSIAQTGQLT